MELEYDYKKVDWKEVKKSWDSSPYFFALKIMHNQTAISFDSGLDKTKRYKLMVYVDGVMKGTYSNKDNPCYQYMNRKALPTGRIMKLMSAPQRRMLKRMGTKAYFDKLGLTSEYVTPLFDNIAQIKKMVTALE